MRIFLLVLVFLLSPIFAFAAGKACDATAITESASVYQVQVECTADDTDASFAAPSVLNKGYCLNNVYIVPGTVTVPTNLMDVVITLWDTGFDLLGGEGANIVTSAASGVGPKNADAEIYLPCFYGNAVITATNNSQVSATITYILTFLK